MMIFWLLVLKLEISYNRLIISLEGFWFLLEDFWKIIYVCMVQYLSLYNSSFALRR